MFRRYKIKKKMLYIIELLKDYFKDRDAEVYSALCNAKWSDIKVMKKKYSTYRNNGGDEANLICTDKENTICIDFDSGLGLVEKVDTRDIENLVRVENFHDLIGLDNYTYCTLAMIINYLTK